MILVAAPANDRIDHYNIQEVGNCFYTDIAINLMWSLQIGYKSCMLVWVVQVNSVFDYKGIWLTIL